MDAKIGAEGDLLISVSDVAQDGKHRDLDLDLDHDQEEEENSHLLMDAELIEIVEQFVEKHRMDISSCCYSENLTFQVPEKPYWRENEGGSRRTSWTQTTQSDPDPVEGIQALSPGLLCDTENLLHKYAQVLGIESELLPSSLLKNALTLIQAFTIFSNNTDNISLLASSTVVYNLVLLTRICLRLMQDKAAEDTERDEEVSVGVNQLLNVLESVLILLESICSHSVIACNCCANESLITTLIDILELPSLYGVSIRSVLRLFTVVSSHRISVLELKRVFRALRASNEALMLIPLLNTLSCICSKTMAFSAAPSHYFCFTCKAEDGLRAKRIEWPAAGQGFTFHAWVKLDPQLMNLNYPQKSIGAAAKRYQLYSIVGSNRCGFEAFFLSNGSLVVGSFNTKDFFGVQLPNVSLFDNQWHVVDISYSSFARALPLNPFGPSNQCLLTVFVDGIQRTSVQLNINAAQLSLSEIEVCCIGSSFDHKVPESDMNGSSNDDTSDLNYLPSKEPAGNWASKTFKPFRPVTNLFSRVISDRDKILNPVQSSLAMVNPTRLFYTSKSGANLSKTDDNLQVIPNGTQDKVWGSSICLRGFLSSVCIFCDGLQPNHVKQLYLAGANSLTSTSNVNASEDLVDCFSKLVVYFNAKAYDEQQSLCTNLTTASSPSAYGSVSGTYVVTTNIKDVINSIGGLQVVYPILEIIAKMGNEGLVAGHPSSPVPPVSHLSPDQFIDDWVVLSPKRCQQSELTCNKHPVASFFNFILRLIDDSDATSINSPAYFYREQISSKNGFPIIGLLLQRLPNALVNVDFLLAVQQFVEELSLLPLDSDNLISLVHKYIVFEFRIWIKGDFTTQIGHVQYLFSLIKNERKRFRKEFGIQFFLDRMRHYYVPESSNSLNTNVSDLKAIRHCLLRIIRYYMTKDVNCGEVSALISLLVVEDKDEFLVSEVLDSMLTVLKTRHAKDQLFLLLYEPNACELLYSLLVNETFECVLKVKLLKMIILLLKSDKVYEKSKARLRLRETGFSCLAMLLRPNNVNCDILSLLLDLTLLPASKPNGSADADLLRSCFEGVIVFLQFIEYMDLNLKINMASKIMKVLMLQVSNYSALLASLVGWQESVVSLLVKRQIPRSSPRPSMPNLRTGIITTQRRHSSYSTPMLTVEEEPTVAAEFRTSLAPSPSPVHLLVRRLSHQLTSAGDSTVSAMSQTAFFSQIKDHITNALSVSQESLQSCGAYSAGSFVNSNLASPTITTPDHEYDPDPEFVGGKEEMLLQLVGEIAFMVTFRGLEGSSKEVWLQRGQIFALLDMLAFNNQFHVPLVKVKQFIFRKALHNIRQKLYDGSSNDTDMENIAILVRFLFDFVVLDQTTAESNPITEDMLDQILDILDMLEVFGLEGWTEMATMGLGILLSCCTTKDLTLCARATAKLHGLIQNRCGINVDESCYLLIALDEALIEALDTNDEDHYSFIIPVLRAVIEKLASPRNNMKRYLSGMPSTLSGPSFYEEFQHYAQNAEWRRFIEKVVRPHHDKYYADHVVGIVDTMNAFWNEAHEAAMVSRHKREREKGESKLRFQSHILNVAKNKAEEEKTRFSLFITKLNGTNLSALKRWRLTKLHLYGALNGPWYRKGSMTFNMHWKLGLNENYFRMKPKLTLNSGFDSHREASWLRDNVGVTSTKRGTVNSFKQVAPALSRAHSKEEEYHIEEEELLSLLSQNSNAEDEEDTSKSSPTRGSRKEETVMISEDCELVYLMSSIKGKFEVTSVSIMFTETANAQVVSIDEGRHDFKYPLNRLREIYLRRFAMRRSSIEFFLMDQTNFFINFYQQQKALRVYGRVLALRPHNLIPFVREVGFKPPSEIMRASGITEKWMNREISNFEYLMVLNTVAGRTYNDLGQYPIFPWILSDYVSNELDIENPNVYRDFSRPIGVVNPQNVEKVRSKYESFLDVTGEIEKFHYGTHYSNSAGILHYLVRLEPFTSLHIELQSGRFDCADRQFYSFESTWNMLMDNPNDVKELIPEFFYLPEFLTNLNEFDLGRLQFTKKKVDGVRLPPWAPSPEDFCHLHRKALESEHVSMHINQWIDLIFGFKQKGQAAIDALNVFYYVSYEDAIDLDAIKDERERSAIEGMISNFGQTPSQLFKEPHPTRHRLDQVLEEAKRNYLKPIKLLLCLNRLQIDYFDLEQKAVFLEIPYLKGNKSSQNASPLVIVSSPGSVSVYNWLPYDRNKTKPNSYTIERAAGASSSHPTTLGPLHPTINLNAKLIAVSPDGKTLISAGFWDNTIRSFKISSASTFLTSAVVAHCDLVTCICIDILGIYLVSGSQDTTCKVWELSPTNTLPSKPLHTLYGHDSFISDVGISVELDMVITVSLNAIINVYTLKEGIYLKTMDVYQPINKVVVSYLGHIIIQSGSRDVDVFSINGKHLCSLNHEETPISSRRTQIVSMIAAENYLFIADSSGLLTIYEIYGLKKINSLQLEARVSYMSIVGQSHYSHILVSLENARLAVITPDI